MECLFCRIAAGTVPVTRVYDDADCMAFADINPQAPVHVLVIPKRHVASAAEVTAADALGMGLLLVAAAEVARLQGLEEEGYRLVINTGRDGGQTVGHLHVHVLGGRPMRWPPG